MSFALDASVVADWAAPAKLSAAAEAALESLATEPGVVPAFWWFDVRDALLGSERRQQRDAAATGAFLQRLARLPVMVDHEPDEAALLDLARLHALELRDATYLELALRRGVKLATSNPALIRTAAQAGVALLAAP